MTPEQIAVFGGSFNPPHLAHVLGVATVLATEPVDRILVVPTWRHPFGKPLAPFEDRVEMCRRAFRGCPRTEVSEIERELGGDSYTVRTLEALAERAPGARLALCVGADVLAERSLWHRAHELDRLARLVVLGRQGYDNPPEASPPLPPISSTDVRQRIARGADVSHVVPHEVLEWIRARGLYRDEPAG